MIRSVLAGFLFLFAAVSGASAQNCGTLTNLVNGTNADATQVNTNLAYVLNCAAPRGYLSGLILSTVGGSSAFGIAGGAAKSDDNATQMNLAASYTKTTSAWAVGSGNGSLDTGAINSGTWYHVFLIERIDTAVVDVLVSLSATAPTLPTNYTKQRRIGSMKTDSSANWVKFIQDGDKFRWASVVQDVNVANPGLLGTTRQLLSVPLGVRVQADISVVSFSTNGSPGLGAIYVSDLLQNDIVASVSSLTFSVYNNGLTVGQSFATGAPTSVMTDTSQQIRTRCSVSAADVSLIIVTQGWTDLRGR